MAQRNSGVVKTKPKTTGSKGAVSRPAQKQTQKRKPLGAEQEREAPRFFDARTKRDIWAVILAIFAIAILVIMVVPSNALLASFLYDSFHLVFGFGAYILPVMLFAVAGSFLIPFERTFMSARFAIGLGMIFLAILVLLALSTPAVTTDISLLFIREHLAAKGGYVGAGVAWVGLTLLGQVVSAIIMVGLIVSGLVVIGLSLSKPIEKILAYSRSRAGQNEEGDGVSAPAPFLRLIRRPSPPAHKPMSSSAGNAARRPRRALLPLDTPLDEEGTGAALHADEKATTRKLGKKAASDAAAPTNVLPKQSPAASFLAAPHPQEGFELPPMDLLSQSPGKAFGGVSADELKETAGCLQETLEDFGIFAQVVGWVAGPTVTLFKVDLPSGVRVSRVTALEDDIALALAAPGVRIFAPIPGTNYVGIEVPNKTRKNVLLGDILRHAAPGPLQIAIGMDVEGRSIISDLAKMPHLLIGGTTGSGKSVSINAMVMSILMRATPAEVRFIMIDPKRVEFTPYNGIPHLYVPVVTEPREAASALSWGVAEMERRLKVFSSAGARNIGQYNLKVQQGDLDDEYACEMPYIVIVIDELADLMMNVGKEVEFSISRIAQLARAAGIHLIVATQRPSTNVVTGLIKVNITNRIAFNVASGIDSRVVLDTPGAENLIGLGDLLLSKPEFAKPQRIQGCYVSEEEINAVVDQLRSQGEPEYHTEILKTNLITLGASSIDGSGGGSGGDDPLTWEAAEIVVSTGLGSTSNIQRRLKVGYSRAGRIMDILEEKGVVGPPNGSKPREVLVDEIELETLKAFEARDLDGVQSFAEE